MNCVTIELKIEWTKGWHVFI